MSGGIRYRIARWLEDNRLTRRLVLRFEMIGPTGKRIYKNRVGGWLVTGKSREDES